VLQVAGLLRAEVADIISHELKDPRIGFVTVTDAEASADLRHARIFVSILGTDEEQRTTFAALTSAAGFIRRCLGRRIELRYVPELTFHLDKTPERASQIQRLLQDLHEEKRHEA